SIQSATFSSQGHRSRSSSGCPARILAISDPGWRSSPSSKAQPSRSARAFAIVVLPDPETPVTTRMVRTPAMSAPADSTTSWSAVASVLRVPRSPNPTIGDPFWPFATAPSRNHHNSLQFALWRPAIASTDACDYWIFSRTDEPGALFGNPAGAMLPLIVMYS